VVWQQEKNVKPLITCRITDYFCCDFYEKIKSSEDFLKKVLSTEKYDWANVENYKCLNIACFLAKCINLVFVGVLTIGIQNSCILQAGYVPHLSDKVRCSQESRFSITKIWYAHKRTGRHFTGEAEKICPENNNLP